MQFTGQQKFARMSPKKIRPVASMIKKLSPQKAIEVLPYVGVEAGRELLKVIRETVASAGQKGISISDLVFKEIQINEGPRLKKGREVSRGRWHPYKKRMSHIKVILESKIIPEKKLKAKSEKPIEKDNLKEKIKNKDV